MQRNLGNIHLQSTGIKSCVLVVIHVEETNVSRGTNFVWRSIGLSLSEPFTFVLQSSFFSRYSVWYRWDFLFDEDPKLRFEWLLWSKHLTHRSNMYIDSIKFPKLHPLTCSGIHTDTNLNNSPCDLALLFWGYDRRQVYCAYQYNDDNFESCLDRSCPCRKIRLNRHP